MKKAFSLIEIMIVMAILGILGAIVFPLFQDHIAKAKESTAKSNLKIIRDIIEVYAAQHNDVAPGYLNGNADSTPSSGTFDCQLRMATNKNGQYAAIGTDGYDLGPYLKKIPQNPFKPNSIIKVLGNNEDFPAEAIAMFGWIYKPATKEFRLSQVGTDLEGVKYYDY